MPLQDMGLTVVVKTANIPQAQAELKALGATMTKLTKHQNGSITATGKQASVMNNLAGATDRAGKATDRSSKATDRASKSHKAYFGHIAATTVQSALINKLFLEMVDVAGQAIQQVDLMNNFPDTMASMGQSTADASESLKKLTQYIGQVGGSLADATSMVTRFTGATKNVKAATAIYVGLNNALIAGDSSMQEQRLAAIQFAQALERGKPDMREWMSLTQNMSFQLAQVAKEMGYVSANALGEALRSGEESMGSFTTKLTEMSTGTGPIAQQALARMQGMQFAFNVLKNTMVVGLASIIQAIGRQNIVSFFTFLTQVVQVLAQAVVFLINALVTLFNLISGLFGGPQININLGDTPNKLDDSAGSAGDLADGLGDAGKEAKKLNKSLASFDKMNVLPDKESGSDSGGKDDAAGGGGTNFDSGEMQKLMDAFGNIGGKLQEVSLWAKIFAGILGSIAAIKFAQKIIEQIDDIVKSFKKAGSAVAGFKTSLIGGTDESGEKVDGLAQKIKNFPVIIGGSMKSLGGLLTNPWVLLAIAIAVVVGGILYLYKTNEEFKKGWDSVWGPIIEDVKTLAAIIWGQLILAFEWVKKTFEDMIRPMMPALQPIIDFFKDLARQMGLLDTPMKTLGKTIGILAGIIVGLIIAPILIFIATVTIGIGIIVGALMGIVWAGTKIWEIFVGLPEFFSGIAESIQESITGVGDWFVERFSWAYQNIEKIFNALPGFFSEKWNNVKTNLASIGTWFKEKFKEAYTGITAIFDFLGVYFGERWEDLKKALSNVGTWFKETFLTAWNNLVTIFNALPGFFQERWDNLKANLSNVGQWFKETFQGAWNNITGVFSNLWIWFRDNVWGRIVGLFSSIGSSIGDTIGSAFKGAVNTAINAVENIINGAIRAINVGIRAVNSIPLAPDISELKTVSLPRMLARGGIVDRATPAIIGEDGAEAVVPLENNLEWIDKLASKINGNGGNGQPVQIVIKIGEETIASKVIDLINEKTQMSGRNAIYV